MANSFIRSNPLQVPNASRYERRVDYLNMKTLSLDKCPHGMFAIALNDEDKKIGTRITSNKCCGRWNMMKTWKLTGKQLREITNEFMCTADDENA